MIERIMNIYAKWYFRFWDFCGDHRIFGRYWLKELETEREYYKCPYCKRIIEKEGRK